MKFRLSVIAAVTVVGSLVSGGGTASAQPIYITFVWHMHQPIYWPGEDILTTAGAGHYSFSPVTVHTDRSGPYTA